MTIDKNLLLSALKSDKEIFDNALRNTALAGKLELTAQFIQTLESGTFDVVDGSLTKAQTVNSGEQISTDKLLKVKKPRKTKIKK